MLQEILCKLRCWKGDNRSAWISSIEVKHYTISKCHACRYHRELVSANCVPLFFDSEDSDKELDTDIYQ